MVVLLTGGGGFIGSHFAEYLLENTEKTVHILDNFSTGNSRNVDEFCNGPRVEVNTVDIREEESVRNAVRRADEVYHFAAAVGVKNVVDNPLQSLQTNLEGTKHVLDAAAEDRTPVFIASSSEVYGKSPDLPFQEDGDRLLGPTSSTRWGYATSKAADEFLALAHHEENDLPVVIGRFFNVVGPRQSGDYGMVIPRFVEQALDDDPLTVYGDGTQTRCFTHVRDAVRATYELMNTEAAHGEVFNVGTEQETSINELAERVVDVTDSDSQVEHIPFEEVYGVDFEEPDHRRPDVSKLESTLGWAPDSRLDRILADVVKKRTDAVEVPARE